MKATFKFENGVTLSDVITGFKGVVTGRADYLTGCNQYLLRPARTKEDGSLAEAAWFDEQRLALDINAKQVVLETAVKPGADNQAPIK